MCCSLLSRDRWTRCGGLILVSACLVQSASAALFVGVNARNQLVTFDDANPTASQTPVTITGVNSDIVDLAWDGNVLYGMSLDLNTYTIDLSTGVASLFVNGDTAVALSTFNPGFAYDGTSGSLVWAGDNGELATLSTTGGGGWTVGSTSFAAGDSLETETPNLFGAAFDPRLGTAYFLSQNTTGSYLLSSNDLNLASVYSIGALGVDVISAGDLSIDAETGTLFAVLSEDGANYGLYQLDTDSGAATRLGDTSVVTFTAVPEPGAISLALAGLGLLLGRRRRA